MKTLLRGTDINSAFGVVETFMIQNLRWVKTTVTSAAANVTFTIGHNLGVKPDIFLMYPWVAGNGLGATQAEQSAWNGRIIAVHSSASAARYTVLIGTFN